ncbi:MAG: hypothetical protein K0U74_08270, partial [Alphaproteobacteria bacterium]|nr:hypothetical protein [Alphaproteobacteria bacterium]
MSPTSQRNALSTAKHARALSDQIDSILFLKRRVDPAGEWRGSIWVIGQAARRTGRPPLGNPKGRA